jgi:hypothetical protein
MPSRRRRACILSLIASAALAASCSESASVPTPQPTPVQDGWYTFVVQCSDCPGLTNAEIDRTVTPHRARLHVGKLTSLRAAVRDGCEAPQGTLQITRWVPSDPSVIKVEPSSSESAIVTALAPGVSSITVERQLPTGGLSQRGLRDVQTTSGCGLLPEIVFEILP